MIEAKIRKPIRHKAASSLYMTMTGFLEEGKDYLIFKRINSVGETEIVLREWKFDSENMPTGLYRSGITGHEGEKVKEEAIKASEKDNLPDVIIPDDNMVMSIFGLKGEGEQKGDNKTTLNRDGMMYA